MKAVACSGLKTVALRSSGNARPGSRARGAKKKAFPQAPTSWRLREGVSKGWASLGKGRRGRNRVSPGKPGRPSRLGRVHEAGLKGWERTDFQEKAGNPAAETPLFSLRRRVDPLSRVDGRLGADYRQDRTLKRQVLFGGLLDLFGGYGGYGGQEFIVSVLA